MNFRILTFSILIFSALRIFSQDFRKIYGELIAKGDLKKLEIHLKNWKAKKPNDPEMFIGYFNYYLRNAQEIAAKDKSKATGISKDGTGYSKEEMKNAFTSINEGIKLYPHRLDMRFGKITMLAETGDFKSESEEIITVLMLSKKNKNNWNWIDNKKMIKTEKEFLESIQHFINQYFQTTQYNYVYIKNISEKMVENYPNNVYGYNNISTYYLSVKDYESALKYLKSAEKLNPKDYIVLNNIAFSYESLKQNKKAIEYYTKAIKHCPDQLKEKIDMKIDRLKK